MTTASPSVRHPFVLSMWAALFVITGLALSNPMWLALVFLASPFVAIGTFSVVYVRRESEVLRPGWSIAYRIVSVLLAIAGVAGVIASAGRLGGSGAQWFDNGPLAVLFLLAFLFAWPTVTKPSPRRAAIPAMIVHISWLPLVIANAVMERDGLPARLADTTRWHLVVGGVSLIAILALSALLAVLSVVGFTGEPRIAAARATERM